jgi:hypothetical protein
MERVRFIKHKGRDIICIDISNSKSEEENIEVLQKAREFIDVQAPKSALLLTDVTNAHYGPRGAEAMKAYSKANTPFVKASAVVGVTGIKRVIYQAIVKMTGRHIATFDTVEQALDWLAVQ